jgi:hypothetical protein
MELKEACENVRNQIDVLKRSRYSRTPDYGGDDLALAMLNDTLEQLEQALANVG